jgi:hypothetical protein
LAATSRTGAAQFVSIAGFCAFAAAAGGLLYSVLFVLLQRGASALAPWVALLLMGGGLVTLVVMVALYQALRQVNPPVPLLALLVAAAGALGATLHGAYDLATSLHPAGSGAALPSPVDPRGFMTFGMAGAGLLLFGWLMLRSRLFATPLSYLALVSGVLLVVIYLGRLVILTPTNPLVIGPAAIEGLIVNPAFYIWLGLTLRRSA